MTNAEAWLNIALRPRKPEGSLGRTAQDGHLDSHTASELCQYVFGSVPLYTRRKPRESESTPDLSAAVTAWPHVLEPG